LCAQSWQQGAYNLACAEKVGFENIFEFGSIEFLDCAHQTVTGVIDDYIDLAEPRDRRVRGALDRCSICYIYRDGENAIRRPQNLLGAACVTRRCDHGVAFFKHRLCDRETQPA
jgi:hypothetical protein